MPAWLHRLFPCFNVTPFNHSPPTLRPAEQVYLDSRNVERRPDTDGPSDARNRLRKGKPASALSRGGISWRQPKYFRILWRPLRKQHKAPPALKNVSSTVGFEADCAGRRNSWGQEVQNARPSLQTLLPRISASHEDLIAAHDAEGKVVLYRCPKVYKRTLTALRPSPQPSSSGRLSFRASEKEKIVREHPKEVVYTQEGTDQGGRYRGEDQGRPAGSWFRGEGVYELEAEVESESGAITQHVVAMETQEPDHYRGPTLCSHDMRRDYGPASSRGHGTLIPSAPGRARFESQHHFEPQVEVPEKDPERFTNAYDEGAVEIEAPAPRSHPLCALAGVSIGDLQAKIAPAAMAIAEEAHARTDDKTFSDTEPGMQSTLGSAEEPAELESGEAKSNVGHGEDAAWLDSFDDISESDALTWTEDTCACLAEVMGRMQAEPHSRDHSSYPGPSNGAIAMHRGTINTEEVSQPAEVEVQQGSVNSIADTQVSSTVSALMGSSTASPSISRRASTIRPDSIAEGEALAEEHEKYIPYRLSMARSSSSPPLHCPARGMASSKSSFGKWTSSATAPGGL
ncbi:hypothetical protein KC327_g7387 [Hortaea werneckii]|nr:hypothetical protein KC350_g14863 [Hortaea werneckii]KAI6822598.1 hypothetical protein KC358_g8804 [Hortaea werneckii]KAI6923450.1 hypothetical protein KC341_g14732 [Hortaea werneckii]KAI6929165.1 hypothetical protein KC348_g7925 [Hortaea werneckii]KAI6959103.1 hypothetical protein KC321_g13619 [Hortaea werneckii]